MALQGREFPAFLRDDLRGHLRQEDFKGSEESASEIEGFKGFELRTGWADDGFFAELGRIGDDFALLKEIGEQLPDFRLRQLNLSHTLAGQVKGFHLHLKQDEVWFIPPQTRAIIGAIDARRHSTTSGNVARLVLKGDNRGAMVVHFPKGVAHSICPVESPLTMVVGVSKHFDGMDEYRLPYDFNIGDDFWKIPHG